MTDERKWNRIRTYYVQCNFCEHIWDNYFKPYAGCPLCQSQNLKHFAYEDLKEVEFTHPSIRFPRKWEIEKWIFSKRSDIPFV